MKHIWKLAIFLLALNLYGQDTSHTAQKIYSGPSSSGSCAYSATAPDPVLVVGGVLYVCGPGNTFVPTGGGTSNYQTVQVAGAAQPVEPALNFPSGVACTDNPGVATNCTPSANYQTVQVAGSSQAQEPALNFTAGVTCTDNSGVSTNCHPSVPFSTISVGANSGLTAGVTYYLGPFGATTSSGSYGTVPTTNAGTISNLYCHVAVAPTSSNTDTFTILNASGTSENITCQITGAANNCNDTSDTWAPPLSTNVTVKLVVSGSATNPVGASCSFQLSNY